ncbi:MAG: RHS repeat-associated core domain-containing protein, partial [Micromonosporaceae bacterium]
MVDTGSFGADSSLGAKERRLAGADSTAADESVVLAVSAASSSSDTGDFSKTPFSASYEWQAGGSGADFSWSYGLDTPPSPGEMDPEVGLSYSSGAVDGQTAGKNVQPSWVGEGWDYTPGFIERSYRPCADDQEPTTPHYTNATGDLCWRRGNARLVWDGQSTELILGDDNVWRAADDDAAKVEKITSATSTVVNGDDNGEYWRITTTDGTRFYFGRNELFNWAAGDRETKSAWTVPVFGNHDTDQCFKTGGFAGSWCHQAWRWNLDYVVDRHGNSLAYFYGRDRARTGLAGSASNTTTYDRGGWLNRIEYGTRSGTELDTTTPPAQVLFDTAERCLINCWTGAAWDSDPVTANWPDTPWDLHCATSATSCPDNVTPSFWTTRRLVSARTQIFTGLTYEDVSRWDFTHTFPATGNGTSPVLWLDSIKQTGLAGGGSIELPTVSFGGTRFDNRADYDPTRTMAQPRKYRITTVNTETGGQIEVTYSGQDTACQFGGTFPTAHNNTKRCFPQWYKPDQAPAGFSWWHKYIVTKVTERDLTGGSPDVVTAYDYSTAGSSTAVLWAHDDGPATWSSPLATRSWANWRGYPTVTTTTGPAGGTQTQTKDLYFRGLNGDHTDLGENTRVADVTNSLGEV